MLLLEAGAVVSRARLIEELWGASPPPSAAKALNVHVSQLRKSLARNGDQSIVTRRPGYVLQIGRERLDAARFERLVAEARERVVGDPGSARHLLSEGLALWRGPVLDDVELAAGARNEAGRLEELRLSAQMDRIDCDLGLGLHDQVIGELEALVAEHPLRERLRSQLMLALYRSGQQADALACYREARETLVGELGIEPSVPLQRLERAILNHDPSLEAVSGVARNAPLREERVVAHRRPSRRRRAAAIAMTAGAGIAAGLAMIVGGSSGRNSEAEAVVGDSVVAVDAANERVKAISQLGGSPAALAPAGDSVWTLDTRDAAVSKLDPRTGALLRTVSARSAPSGLAVGEGWVWVIGTTHQRGVVVQFDPATGEVANTRLLGPMTPRAVVAGEGGVWIAAELPGRPGVLLRLSPSTAAVVSKLPLPVKPTAIALGQHEIWISGAAPASRGSAAVSRVAVYRVDAATGRIVAHAVLAADPGRSRIAVGPVGLWLSDGRGALLRLDPPTARVVAKTHVPAVPAAIAADDRSLWVIDGSSILWRLDPADGRVRSHARLAPNGRARPTDLAVGSGTIWASFTRVAPAAGDTVRRTVRVGPMRAVSVPVPGTPTRLRFGAGAIWVKSLSAEVTRIDPRTNRVAARITVGSGWGDFAFGFGSVWVTSFDTNTVSRIDPQTNRIVARISTAGLAPMGIAATRDAVWVANHHADPNSRLNRTGSVVRIDPRTNRVVAKIPVGAPDTHGGPDNMTAGARDVWLDIPNQALVVRISASTNRVAARIPVEAGCGHLAAGADAIWVAEGCSDSIVRIDPKSNALIRRITTSANTYPVAFARGSVWATTNDLRLIRIDPTSNSIVDSFDITPATRPTGGPWFTVAAGSFWLSDSNRNRVLRVNLPR